ncbi:MAG: hypothetical protein US86_C0013G0008 [Candidatus Daviesbacteria bacterium GW2011_GWA2_38_24]|uniref:KOW domain-containing protein n=1 Tax=Candidatus Daviesbacteria bacterium GW2011_GWA2_38_24 TaxID=1618422 RepID=A0A0G0JE76_9BACT|nr:MAG: hypothetical protein US86_C0013G0008 [Candidatus Daviesbacteria bacterium GW2011_GWA2_38_24]KKQ79870.1 MAG: hypothetical protein UT01_C0025G0003 [Candidatus Daviesbacteria bacterium GW2011_GWA1_38_7]OGE23678.1 MAG: hypothetical protein A2688_00255 [Candidatus Daviesbacteria bacterium RIFCSPHIGHO2_01_FULL_38_8]
MNLSINFRHRIRNGVVTHIKRKLTGNGQITARVNQVIEPHDIIGKSLVTAGFSTISLSKALGVNPKEAVNFLQKPLGASIYKGELLALKKGMLGLGDKVVVSPTDCVLDSFDDNTGELRLKFLPKDTPLISGVYGIVDRITQNNEVIIRTHATEINGLFGSGIQRFGPLRIMGKRESLITKTLVLPTDEQHILVAGAMVFADALREAVSKGVTGIISGGLNARDFKSMSGFINPSSRVGTDIGISLVVTEGFGPIPLGEDVFSVFQAHEGNFIFVLGNSARILLPTIDSNCIMTIRKTALPISNLPERPAEVDMKDLHQGDKVRIVWPPFMGTQGKVLSLDLVPTTLPSGINTYLVTVETPSRKVKVPFTNIELVG